jgi:hypothetical protein
MPRDDFRREISDAFSRITGASSSDLPVRVRSAIIDAPERRGPVWLAGVAAVAIAALVVGALFVIGPLRAHQPPIAGGPTPSPSAVTTVSPTPSASASPTDNLPAFVCTAGTVAGSRPPQTAFVDAVRGGTHPGYDRITIEFSNGEPARVEITLQSNATFTQGASGQTVQLQGSDGLLITIRGADEHTHYSGSTDFHVGSGILEARQVQDFEGVVQWGLGLAKPGCYRVFYLANPDRLVIDVQTS